LARGRTRSFDRDQALTVAVRLFADKGYAATRVAELCQAMGINSPSFYAAFTGKEALYEEAVERVAADKECAIFSALDPARPTRDGIEDVLLRTIDQGATPVGPPGCLVTLSFVSEDDSPALSALGREKRRVAYDVIRDWIADGVGKGDLAPDTPVEALARMVATFQQGIAVQTRDGVPAETLRPAVLALMAGWPWTEQLARA
jgi:AcrR family transcriptional regulator